MTSHQKSPVKIRLARPKQTRRMLTRSRVIRYGLRNLTRNAWLTIAATAVMTVTLLIILATVVMSQMLSSTVVKLRDNIDVSIYFDPKTDDDTLRNLAGKMQLVENVKGVTISNSQSEYDKFVEENKNDRNLIKTIADIEINFPAVMHVKINDLNNVQPIRNMVEEDPQYQKWIYTRRQPTYAGDQQQTINTIASWADLAQRGGLTAAAVFLIISILVIFNTIRMAIFSRREEIEMMKLVGADKSFIRGPFLIEAAIYGILAALIATALGFAAFAWLTPRLSNYGVMVDSVQEMMVSWWWVVLAAMIAIGVAIGYVSARLSARRYLKWEVFHN
ncbi:ABC transporter permease [Candidatus Saccharibacteria bacterium]|nr:ABC transporter permease [Candidatus Saccharibacteria bacterium]